MPCCCDPAAGDCCECEAVPLAYRVPISGVMAAVCDPCAEWDLIHRIDWAGDCTWVEELLVQCPALGDQLIGSLVLSQAGTDMVLVAYFSNIELARWSTPCSGWSCLGVNTMANLVEGAGCIGWPDTVTLTPV